MKVPKSSPSDLVRDGASVRLWHDSWAKLKELARIRGTKFYQTFDDVVTDALQVTWDVMLEEGKTPDPLELPEKEA